MQVIFQTLSTLGWGLVSFSALGLSNSYSFVTTRHTAQLPRLQKPVRIAHLSDLHYGMFVGLRTIRRWVDATMREKPDLIVITGDILDSGVNLRGHPDLMRELSRLWAPLGVYAVWGNHDWTSLNTNATRGRFAERLRLHGIRLINNTGVQLRDDLYLCGVDDWWFGTQDLGAAMRHHSGGAVVLLSHNPDFLMHVPRTVDLTLSGHTHGGQVRLPLFGALKQRSTLLKALHGWVRGSRIVTSPAEGEASDTAEETGVQALGYVSRGLGVTGVPLRIRCPAEIVMLDLLPQA